jgi:hypothetical protein
MPRQIHILFNLLALFVIMYIVVDTFYSIVGMQLYKAAGPQVVMLEDIATDAAEPSTRKSPAIFSAPRKKRKSPP